MLKGLEYVETYIKKDGGVEESFCLIYYPELVEIAHNKSVAHEFPLNTLLVIYDFNQ